MQRSKVHGKIARKEARIALAVVLDALDFIHQRLHFCVFCVFQINFRRTDLLLCSCHCHNIRQTEPHDIIRVRSCLDLARRADNRIAAAFNAALRRACEGRTVLSVSHRIYENLGGRTIEIGSQRNAALSHV